MSKQNETSEFLPPVKFQNGESVRLRLGRHTDLPCRILATKSTAKFIYYDLEVWLYSLPEKAVDPDYTRLYHVESRFVFDREKEGPLPDSNFKELEPRDFIPVVANADFPNYHTKPDGE